jgi:hypothetical protein
MLVLFGNHFQVDCEFSIMVFLEQEFVYVEMPELLSQWKIKTYGEQGLIALPIE